MFGSWARYHVTPEHILIVNLRVSPIHFSIYFFDEHRQCIFWSLTFRSGENYDFSFFFTEKSVMRMFEAKIVCLWKKSFGRTTEEHSSYNIENDLYTISRTLKGLRSRWTFMGLGGAGAPPRWYYGIERTICSTLCYFRSLIYENCVSVQSVQPQPRRAASESIFNNFMMKKQIFPKAEKFFQ